MICSRGSKIGRKFDHLADVEVFLNGVEHGSFSAAAVVLSRAASRLEARLGAPGALGLAL